MNLRKFCLPLPLALAAVFVFNTVGYSIHPDIVGEFKSALDRQNPSAMKSIVERNKGKMPVIINELLDKAVRPGLSKEKREENFFILERLAAVYRDVTGDATFLNLVKKGVFESRLTPEVVSRPTAVFTRSVGMHVVRTVSTGALKDMFRPDNMIIKAGDTVRWVNNGTANHLLASVLTSIGKGGIFSPMIEPGQSWDHTFHSPGEYYYVCFSHKVMYGKIVVKE